MLGDRTAPFGSDQGKCGHAAHFVGPSKLTHTGNQVPRLLNCLGGEGKELRRHLNAEEPRRLQVEDQLELGRAHRRKVRGFAAG
jgi:hypothetical protein